MKNVLKLAAVAVFGILVAACGPRGHVQPSYGVDVSVHGGGHHHGRPHYGHAHTPPVIHPDYVQVSSGYGRRGQGSCRPGTTWDPSAGACAHGRREIEPGGHYDVAPEQARCTIGSTRIMWVNTHGGQMTPIEPRNKAGWRQIHQTCTS